MLTNKIYTTAALMAGLLFLSLSALAQNKMYKAPQYDETWSQPTKHPDHINLTFTGDPATSFAVTWRTDASISESYAEIAPATAAPRFWRRWERFNAKTETMDASKVKSAHVKANYHSVVFENLQPDSLYAYRVGDGERWSEWVHYRTASNEPEPFSFLYIGDAQNYILELWSRLIREGYRQAPDASFIIHAGDLVSDVHSESQWHQWYTAGGWIHRMLPSVPVPGNHEYEGYTEEEEDNDISHLSVQWKPQFTLPENGPEGMEEIVYYQDYQNLRIVGLNSSRDREKQTEWMEEIMQDNDKKWVIATFHHPVFSASQGRDNEELRAQWKPVFDKYKFDLVLQGHDHSYVRGGTAANAENKLEGINTRDGETGTVYVVSVSGGKMYRLKEDWDDYEASRDRKAENTQLFQVIHIDGDSLKYEAKTATGDLYDAFTLVKQADGPNVMIDNSNLSIAERTHENTIHYEDKMPEEYAEMIAEKYPDYELDHVYYRKHEDFEGYLVEIENNPEDKQINLILDMKGNIIKEEMEKD